MGQYRNQIRALMDERPRLTYSDLATACGKSWATIARWMNEEPSQEQAETLFEAVKTARETKNGGK